MALIVEGQYATTLDQDKWVVSQSPSTVVLTLISS